MPIYGKRNAKSKYNSGSCSSGTTTATQNIVMENWLSIENSRFKMRFIFFFLHIHYFHFVVVLSFIQRHARVINNPISISVVVHATGEPNRGSIPCINNAIFFIIILIVSLCVLCNEFEYECVAGKIPCGSSVGCVASAHCAASRLIRGFLNGWPITSFAIIDCILYTRTTSI